ncbi:P-loop containing nucleoside triphosphate hydrolase protein [Aspergillus floccosus]
MAPLKIIGAGYPRTGTLSLCEALETLGYNCHHMDKIFLDESQDPGIFTRAYTTKSPPDWDEVYRNYDAAVDCPSMAFWEDLFQKYADAKVILTTRDPNAWYDSVGMTIYQRSLKEGVNWPLRLLKAREMSRAIVKDGVLKEYTDKEAMLRQFQEHIVRVQEIVPPGQLLIFDSRQGWEPLCRFLGAAVPKGRPYPHTNRAGEFADRIWWYKSVIESREGPEARNSPDNFDVVRKSFP